MVVCYVSKLRERKQISLKILTNSDWIKYMCYCMYVKLRTHRYVYISMSVNLYWCTTDGHIIDKQIQVSTCLHKIGKAYLLGGFGRFVLLFSIYWENYTKWLTFFRGIKTTNQIYNHIYTHNYVYVYVYTYIHYICIHIQTRLINLLAGPPGYVDVPEWSSPRLGEVCQNAEERCQTLGLHAFMARVLPVVITYKPIYIECIWMYT